jgi:hypothetical protein
MQKLSLILAIIGVFQLSSYGQEKFPYIKISADIAFVPTVLLFEKEQFNGEFFPEGGFLAPEWVEIQTEQNLHKRYQSSGITGRISFNFWKQLQLGVRYSSLNIKGYNRPGVRGGLFIGEENTFFFFVGLSAGYIWYPVKKHPAFSMVPMLGVGTYISDEFFSGPGRKWHVHGSLKTQYLFKERLGLFVAPAFSYWQYRDKGFSNFFDRPTSDYISMRHLGIETGISFQINIDRKP